MRHTQVSPRIHPIPPPLGARCHPACLRPNGATAAREAAKAPWVKLRPDRRCSSLISTTWDRRKDLGFLGMRAELAGAQRTNSSLLDRQKRPGDAVHSNHHDRMQWALVLVRMDSTVTSPAKCFRSIDPRTVQLPKCSRAAAVREPSRVHEDAAARGAAAQFVLEPRAHGSSGVCAKELGK